VMAHDVLRLARRWQMQPAQPVDRSQSPWLPVAT
jgi:hypothetical protein